MRVIYRLKWLQGHPRKLTGRERKSHTQHIVLLPSGNSTYEGLIKYLSGKTDYLGLITSILSILLQM